MRNLKNCFKSIQQRNKGLVKKSYDSYNYIYMKQLTNRLLVNTI